jgi:alginate O-acetyltransferase complex protein AlgI
MQFNSLQYIIFLPIVFVLYYLLNHKYRWFLLLAASYLFYAWLMQIHLLIILFAITVFTYYLGNYLSTKQNETSRRRILIFGLIVNIGILLSFKYSVFAIKSLNNIFNSGISLSSLPAIFLVTIGLSYFIFQALSYLIDIYYEKQEPEPHFGYFALYLAFFPKLLQGPIEKAGVVVPQLKTEQKFDYENFRRGSFIFLFGIFKKVVIADHIAIFVNQVWGNLDSYSGLPLIVAIFAFAFQIYYDFSAYTDMAIGSALILNINLTNNFNHPYYSTSITDFWRRWHISFSKWLMEYVFTPLQISFRTLGKFGMSLAFLITFFICGLWHGASVSFVLWGIYNGLYFVVSYLTAGLRRNINSFLKTDKIPQIHNVFKIIITFIFVSGGWLLFRSESVSQIKYFLIHLKGNMHFNIGDYRFGLDKDEMWVFIGGLILAEIIQLIEVIKKTGIYDIITKYNGVIRWSFYYLIIIVILFYGAFNRSTQFIYFQF